ncbi:MAG: DUF4115 domain-containing protein [bacterium]
MVQEGDIIESFGQYLKRERELRNIPLEEISAYTRIKLRALEAIERDDFSQLPPLAFIRAFIRCYADYLGLNINEVMLNFDSFIQQRFPEMTGEVKKVPRKQRPKQSYLPLAIIITVVIALLLTFWLTRSPAPLPDATVGQNTGTKEGEGTSAAHNVVAKPAGTGELKGTTAGQNRPPLDEDSAPASDNGPADQEQNKNATKYPPVSLTSDHERRLGPPAEMATFPGEEKPEAEEEKQKESKKQDAEPRPQPLHRVSLSVEQACWVRYKIDRDPARDAVLQPGQRVTFEGRESVKITIGNPDGVKKVTYNQQPYDFDPRCAPWHLKFPESPGDNQCPSR